MTDKPDVGAMTRVGIIVAVSVAVVAIARTNRTPHD